MTISYERAQSIVGYSKNRAENDFYATPEYVTRDLLERETFVGNVWEPACGDGAMAKVITSMGYPVISTDLIDRGYGEGGVNFLLENRRVNNVITNPPFLLAERFVFHALKQTDGKVAMFLKLAFLEGQARRDLFENTPIARVWVFSRRVSLGSGKGGMIAFAWFVWEHGYTGFPEIRWI